MGRDFFFYIFLLSVLLLPACQRQDSDRVNVRVCARVEDSDVSSKAATIYEATMPDAEHPLAVNVWFSTDGSAFPSSGTVNASTVSLHRTVTYTNGEYVFPSAVAGAYLQYPTTGEALYCVGLYPQSGWSTANSDTQATHAVDTDTDLMFAPKTFGTKSSLMGRQTYQHLLTWLKVRVRAVDAQAISSWGTLTSITMDTKNTVSITLNNGTVAFSGDGTSSNLLASSQTLTTTSKEVISVFCHSVTASSAENATEYDFHITCDNYDKDISIDLLNNDNSRFSGETAGKLFVVTLSFNRLKQIEATVELVPWEEDRRDITLQATP